RGGPPHPDPADGGAQHPLQVRRGACCRSAAAGRGAPAAVEWRRRARRRRGGGAFPRLPVHVPVSLMQAVPVEEAPAQPQPRPHYVQPRSVRAKRAVEEVFLHKREKRMRRCACDCSC
ncbi:uncharacterized protein GBIM_05974, partial [Gryllus bimaculatus]